MENLDALIGRNLIELRAGRSQKEVAQEMRAHGWKWSQATVWSVEKGERPLRVAEAVDLSEVLHCNPYDFTRTPAQTRLKQALTQVSQLSGQFEKLLEDYTVALGALAHIADSADELSLFDKSAVEDWLRHTPEVMLRDTKEQALSRIEADEAYYTRNDSDAERQRDAVSAEAAVASRGHFEALLAEVLEAGD